MSIRKSECDTAQPSPLKVVFQRRLSSSESCLPPKVVFQWRSSSTEGCLPPKVVFYWRSYSTEGHLPLKVVFHLRLSSTYHNTLVDLIFVRTVNIPNLKTDKAIYWGSMLPKNQLKLNKNKLELSSSKISRKVGKKLNRSKVIIT